MIYFIPTPIGNIDDISVRSLRLLADCHTLFCEDTRVTKKLLSLLSKKHQIHFEVENFISMHSHNEETVLSKIDLSVFDKNVAYLSDAGMPCISDPGAIFIKFCQEKKLKYEVLPGANAAILAYATSGINSSRFIFYGFLPHKGQERSDGLSEILNSYYPTILYESPHRIEKLMDELCQREPLRNIFAIKEATKRFEKRFFGTPCEVQKAFEKTNLKGEWVVIISPKERFGGEPITAEDILTLDLPPKQKAKLLSKITGESIKYWYENLQKK
ncbi:MAG: 16S rRNA (cytidine(1402)-2'-O)-methyltransferase [Sulfurospirillaceae bacterium]|nr:16S rRNA (cytidine(1402)-2'-O)-methyltransferase [Sulfurospirillaceae bacterium]MDD3462174.1 16S rRNA (cytidine(1402)-2'-O)-methyltransferase [Sulfurospirillaceae bacterium]